MRHQLFHRSDGFRRSRRHLWTYRALRVLVLGVRRFASCPAFARYLSLIRGARSGHVPATDNSPVVRPGSVRVGEPRPRRVLGSRPDRRRTLAAHPAPVVYRDLGRAPELIRRRGNLVYPVRFIPATSLRSRLTTRLRSVLVEAWSTPRRRIGNWRRRKA